MLVTAGSARGGAAHRPRAGRRSGSRRCVNVVGPIRSIYRWQGAVEEAEEQLLVMKARAADLAALEARVRALHSYDVPEVLALPVTAGSEDYLAWLAGATTAAAEAPAGPAAGDARAVRGRPRLPARRAALGGVSRRPAAIRRRSDWCGASPRATWRKGRAWWTRRCARCARRPASRPTVERHARRRHLLVRAARAGRHGRCASSSACASS